MTNRANEAIHSVYCIVLYETRPYPLWRKTLTFAFPYRVQFLFKSSNEGIK
jgi:hypothetical protein